MNYIAMPFGWLMMALYDLVKNYGLAVILFALVVQGILTPFQAKSKHSTLRTTRLQPKLKELEKRHGANKQKYNEEVQKLYKEEKINPMSGCLWGLLPFPIIIALYSAIRQPLTVMMGVPASLLADKTGAIVQKLAEMNFAPVMSKTYLQIEQTQFISNHFSSFSSLSSNLRPINYNFLGMNLGNVPQWDFLWKTNWSDVSAWLPGLLLFLLPFASGLLSYFSAKINMKMTPSAGSEQQQATMNNSMLLFMPLMSVYFAFIMPGAIGVYIIASTLFATVRDIYLTKHYLKIIEAEDAAKLIIQREREAEMETKRLETERKKAESNTERSNNTSKKKQQKAERQEQLGRVAEWEKKNAPPAGGPDDPSRVGPRRFARGRAYDPSRFADPGAPSAEEDAAPETAETELAAEQPVPALTEPKPAETAETVEPADDSEASVPFEDHAVDNPPDTTDDQAE